MEKATPLNFENKVAALFHKSLDWIDADPLSVQGHVAYSNRNNAATTKMLSDNSLSGIVRANERNYGVLYCYLSLNERERKRDNRDAISW